MAYNVVNSATTVQTCIMHIVTILMNIQKSKVCWKLLWVNMIPLINVDNNQAHVDPP